MSDYDFEYDMNTFGAEDGEDNQLFGALGTTTATSGGSGMDDMDLDDDMDDDDNDDMFHSGEPFAKRPKHFPDDYASGGGADGGGTAAGADDEVVPTRINDVKAFFPNVTPTAFPVIVNLLAQANLKSGLDLRKLSCATRNVEFMPNTRNASATMRLHSPNAVVTIRSSGSMTIIGAASISEARQSAELSARIIRKALNLTFDAIRFRVRSIAARFNVCSPIRINELASFRLARGSAVHRGLSEVHCSYEPERFNGCVMKLVGAALDNKWIVTCLVFVTGKITIMGARSVDELRFAFDAMVPIIANYIGSDPRAAGAVAGTAEDGSGFEDDAYA